MQADIKKLTEWRTPSLLPALSLNLTNFSFLEKNIDNNILTTIDALRCMRDLLKYENINQCLDLINNNG